MPFQQPLSIPVLPDAALTPLLLLAFSVLTRKVVHKQGWLASFHTVPPRIALAAIGILLVAATSRGSRLTVYAGSGIVAAAVQLLVLFLILYTLCELCHASANKGGVRALWTILGGGLSFGLLTYATFYAATAVGLITAGGGAP